MAEKVRTYRTRAINYIGIMQEVDPGGPVAMRPIVPPPSVVSIVALGRRASEVQAAAESSALAGTHRSRLAGARSEPAGDKLVRSEHSHTPFVLLSSVALGWTTHYTSTRDTRASLLQGAYRNDFVRRPFLLS